MFLAPVVIAISNLFVKIEASNGTAALLSFYSAVLLNISKNKIFFFLNTFCHTAVQDRVLNSFTVYVRFEIFTAVTMKNDVFWDVTLCGSCKNRRFGGI
jgi:hypothetical protein